jgi:hypothetical protein
VSGFLEQLTLGKAVGAVALFAGTLLVSLLVVGFFLVKIPPTYFQDGHRRDVWADRHPALRVAGRIGKNALGVVLILIGVVTSVPGVPGQGVLTILIGLMLLDIPGKRRLERKIVGRPKILRTINRLRKRFGKEPLVLGQRRGAVAGGKARGRPAA